MPKPAQSAPRPLRAALVQQPAESDAAANLNAIATACRNAAAAGCRLVLLPELHNGPYFCQSEDADRFDLAEPIPGPSSERLGAIAAETELVIVGSLFERRAPGLYHNTAVVLDRDGRLAGIYRKMHIPDDPGYLEKFYFTPGDLGFRPVDTAVGRLGVLVCWDQWFPEAARAMTLAGAEVLLYPTAIGWDPDDSAAEQERQLEAWITVQRGHAIANGVPLAACNRLGHEPSPLADQPGIRFWGNSFACGAQGQMLARGTADDPHLVIADLDLGRTEPLRRAWPFLRDRRVDAYGDLLRLWRDAR